MRKPPRLLVVSHTPHYRDAEGRIAGWGATVRELDHLASRFERLVHLAPLHAGPPPASSRIYEAPNVQVVPLRPAGGPRLVDKLAILARFPGSLLALGRHVRRVDAIHVRCPANLSLLAILALALFPGLRGDRPWWVKYAGNWRPEDGAEPLSYRFQRHFLGRPWPGLRVSVNGRWTGQAAHVHTFENPCLTTEELEEARLASREKTLDCPLRLLFVGALDTNKGADLALEALGRIRDSGTPDATLDLVGDGPRREGLEELTARLDLRDRVRFHGALPRSAIDSFYRRAHLLLVPSRTEGWPKVIAEAMAHGVVPVASAVSCIPSTLRELGAGRCPRERTPYAFAEAIRAYVADPDRWLDESRRARAAAERFTYDRHLVAVEALFADLCPSRKP